MTSSGSEVSANAVKPRRSRKTTTISRRWLLSGSSAPPWTIASARAGEKKRLSPREPLELRHLLAHPLLERAVQLRQLVVEALDPQQGAHARQDLRLVIGLVRKSSAPASMPFTRSCPGSSAVIITTGSIVGPAGTVVAHRWAFMSTRAAS